MFRNLLSIQVLCYVVRDYVQPIYVRVVICVRCVCFCVEKIVGVARDVKIVAVVGGLSFDLFCIVVRVFGFRIGTATTGAVAVFAAV